MKAKFVYFSRGRRGKKKDSSNFQFDLIPNSRFFSSSTSSPSGRIAFWPRKMIDVSSRSDNTWHPLERTPRHIESGRIAIMASDVRAAEWRRNQRSAIQTPNGNSDSITKDIVRVAEKAPNALSPAPMVIAKMHTDFRNVASLTLNETQSSGKPDPELESRTKRNSPTSFSALGYQSDDEVRPTARTASWSHNGTRSGKSSEFPVFRTESQRDSKNRHLSWLRSASHKANEPIIGGDRHSESTSVSHTPRKVDVGSSQNNANIGIETMRNDITDARRPVNGEIWLDSSQLEDLVRGYLDKYMARSARVISGIAGSLTERFF